jgi:DNA helicase II / ATP-dependent DNA helicase PcrA
MKFSPQQTAFLDWAINGAGSCVLEAVAGAGKTTTLLAAAQRMAGQVAIMAYNKKIAEEIKAKLTKAGVDWKKAQAGTVHSFGFSAYRKARPGVKVDDRKVPAIVDAMAPPELAAWAPVVVQLVSLAKQSAFGIVERATDAHWMAMAEHHDVFDDEEFAAPRQEIIDLAKAVLAKSTAALDAIDFDDMIFMPLIHRMRFWQFDVIMVDEAQDTNAARRAMVRAMLKRGGRVVAVGDRHQAIYGFTGADADSLDLIARDFNCVQLPLTTTYRCPKAVVEFAQQWVSHIQAAETAPEGSVSHSTMEAFLTRTDLDGEAAVLSRTTKPLVALAFTMIRKRIPCRIEGRDVANRLTKMIRRWKVRTLDALEKKIEDHLARETTKLLAKKQEAKLAEVEDVVETIRTIIDQCRAEGKSTIDDAVAYVDSLFGDNVTNMIVLSTIHKSKGREWRRVFWLDRRGTCPSKWARQAWQAEQEVNLMYVAATRAMEELIELAPALPKAPAVKPVAEKREGLAREGNLGQLFVTA